MILEDLKNNLSKIVRKGTEAQLGAIEMPKLNYFTDNFNDVNQCVASYFSQFLMHTSGALDLERENSGFSM